MLLRLSSTVECGDVFTAEKHSVVWLDHYLSTLLSIEIWSVPIVCLLLQIMVHSYRSCLLPLCKSNNCNFCDDCRIYQATALTFLHLDLKIPLCDGSLPSEDVESWAEHCSHPDNKRKLGQLLHHSCS